MTGRLDAVSDEDPSPDDASGSESEDDSVSGPALASTVIDPKGFVTVNDTTWTAEDDVLSDARAAEPQFPPQLIGFSVSDFSPLALFLHFWPVSQNEM